MELDNSTGLEETQSGEQAEVVAPQQETENPTASASTVEPAAGAHLTPPAEAAGQKGVVDPWTNEDFAMVEEDADKEETGDAPKPAAKAQPERHTDKPAQTREENAAIRAARLRAQREAEATAAARADEAIANSGAVNPYTGLPFTGMKEFQEYGRRVQSAKLEQKARETGRSVDDLREEQANAAFLSELRKQAERKNAEALRSAEQARARREFVTADARNFMERHPEITVEQMEALEKNEQFRRFCGTRYGREPLADLYDDFHALIGNAGTVAVKKAASRNARSTGGGGAGEAQLSPAQKSALDAWNEEHPEMAMTAKEFLGR